MSRPRPKAQKPQKLVFEADAALVMDLKIAARTRRQAPEALLAELVAQGLNQQAVREAMEENLRSLTYREREVLRLIVEGLSNRQIAARLFIGHETVKTHVKSILKKLHVRSKANLRLVLLDIGLRVWG